MLRRFMFAVTAFAAGVAAIGAVIALGNRYLERLQRACGQPGPPEFPWAMLPLGIASTALMALSGLLAYLVRRRARDDSGLQVGATFLFLVALLGVAFSAWFGIVAVLADSSSKLHCGG